MLMTMMMIITIIITMIINIKSDTKQYEEDLLLFSLISFARCSSFNSGCLQASTRQFTQLGLLLSRSNSSPAAADLPLFLTSLLTRSQNQLEIHLRYYKLIIVFHVLLHKKQENTTKRHDSDTKIRISISIICVQLKSIRVSIRINSINIRIARNHFLISNHGHTSLKFMTLPHLNIRILYFDHKHFA